LPWSARTSPAMTDTNWDTLSYLPGFGNGFCSEALPDALPKGQNNPQKVRPSQPSAIHCKADHFPHPL
jgi:hypothetical protein